MIAWLWIWIRLRIGLAFAYVGVVISELGARIASVEIEK